tara:strand:- start:1161 stop:2180 length:1020 start_codon:yes stop_codon:yes gene_type:complete
MAVKNKKAKVLELDNLLSVPTFNRKINFGKNSAAIQFTNSTSPLIISGSNNGLNISGSSISVDATTIAAGSAADGNSFVALDSNNKLIKTSPATITSFGDDVKVHFGDDNDAHIEYNEDGDNFLVISGSSAGIVLSGSTIQIDGTLEGASPLKIAGEVQFTSAGEGAAFNFGPNKEAKIFYEDGATGTLIISGSAAHGTTISGSALVVSTISGIGVGVENSDITHAITLPNNDNSTGRIKANAYVSYSSQRYKKEIKVLDDPMNILNKIEGVSFKWKDTDRLDYGFIAEDVGKVLPNIVSWEDNKRDAQGMDYLKIISFLVEAVKNQQKEINKLKQTLK